MSKHGTTAKITELLKSELVNDKVQLFNLKNDKLKDLNEFETIIIGGSIHVDSMQNKQRKFIDSSLNILLLKKNCTFPGLHG